MPRKDNSDLVVIKSNKIIEARYKLNVREQKFILYIASLIKPEDNSFRYQKVKVKEIEKVLNKSNTKWGSIYKDVEDIIYSLNTKPLRIIKDNGDKLIINWIASAHLKPNSGYVTFEFSNELRPYLLQLKSHFTKYRFKNILHLKSGYSIRLYEILKSHEFKSEVTYEVENLKYILGLEDKYPEYKAFKRSVLKKAQKELKERSDIYFELEEEREDRKVKYLIFKIYKNKKIQTEQLTGLELPLSRINDKIIEAIETIGYNREKALEIYALGFDWLEDKEKQRKAIDFYDTADDYFRHKLDLIQQKMDVQTLKNPKGFFLQSLKEDYRDAKLDQNVEEKVSLKKIKNRKLQKGQKQKEIEQLSQLITKQKHEIIKQLIDLDQTVLEEAVRKGTVSTSFRKSFDASISNMENYLNGKPIVKAQINLYIEEAYPEQFKSIREQQGQLKALKEELKRL